jgi:hypothetical protein
VSSRGDKPLRWTDCSALTEPAATKARSAVAVSLNIDEERNPNVDRRKEVLNFTNFHRGPRLIYIFFFDLLMIPKRHKFFLANQIIQFQEQQGKIKKKKSFELLPRFPKPYATGCNFGEHTVLLTKPHLCFVRHEIWKQ